jgi:hypothetical protein
MVAGFSARVGSIEYKQAGSLLEIALVDVFGGERPSDFANGC